MPSADNNFSLDLILHSEVQKLLDNFASVMRIHVMFYGPQGQGSATGAGARETAVSAS